MTSRVNLSGRDNASERVWNLMRIQNYLVFKYAYSAGWYAIIHPLPFHVRSRCHQISKEKKSQFFNTFLTKWYNLLNWFHSLFCTYQSTRGRQWQNKCTFRDNLYLVLILFDIKYGICCKTSSSDNVNIFTRRIRTSVYFFCCTRGRELSLQMNRDTSMLIWKDASRS